MLNVPSTAGAPYARRRDAWAQGAAQATELDRRRSAQMTHEQRIAEGLALIRIARKLQAGRHKRTG